MWLVNHTKEDLVNSVSYAIPLNFSHLGKDSNYGILLIEAVSIGTRAESAASSGTTTNLFCNEEVEDVKKAKAS